MITFPQRIATGTAHSKIILIGEHSVVYGHPAIALPFPGLSVRSQVQPMSGPVIIDCSYFTGKLEAVPEQLSGIRASVKATLDQLNQPFRGFHLNIHSMIPIGRGLGSSAATAIAVVKSLFKYFEEELPIDKLMELVDIAERHAHGNPSGIDMKAASSDVPIWFQKGKPAIPLHVDFPLHFVVADTGRIGDTRLAVNSIKKRLEIQPDHVEQSITRLGTLAHHAKMSLSKGDIHILGEIMDHAQKELDLLGVSDKGMNRLISAAKQAGALGAKLTGGGKGGCILALAHSEKHSERIANMLQEAGAQQTWVYQAAF